MTGSSKRSRLERYYDDDSGSDSDNEESRDQHKRPIYHHQEVSNNNNLVVSNNNNFIVPNNNNFVVPNNNNLVVYRILCPAHLIGSVIGKNGSVINPIQQHTDAKVNVFDPYPGSDKRVILVYCCLKYRDLDADEKGDSGPVCAAQAALFMVHRAIIDAQDKIYLKKEFSGKRKTKEANILVPASQAKHIIGKSGATIKMLRATSGASIKVSPKVPGDITQSCALIFDNFVQIRGDAEAVRKALFGISSIIYKHPSEEIIPLETSIPEPTSNIIVPSEFPVYPASSLYSAPPSAIPSGHPSLPIVGSTFHGPEIVFPANHHGPLPVFPADHHGPFPIYPSVLPVMPAPAYNTPKCSGELVFRVLCPGRRISRVIGKGGSTIKGIRQESGATIDIDDAKDDHEESIITIISTEATDDAKSAAVEAVLLLQEKINDNGEQKKIYIRLLVPKKLVASLIGKYGSIIIDMRKKTRADVQISKGNKPQRASSSDELVEVSGEVDKVRDALVQIVLRLREYLFKDRMDRNSSERDRDEKLNVPSSDPLYESSLPTVLPYIQQVASLGCDQRGDTEQGLDISLRSRSYGYSSLQVGDEDFGRRPSYTTFQERVPHLEMAIPPSALAKVMGKRGSNLENIRTISGALIDIVESQSSQHDHIARISGTSEQRQSAKNLIQAFIMST